MGRWLNETKPVPHWYLVLACVGVARPWLGGFPLGLANLALLTLFGWVLWTRAWRHVPEKP